MSGFLHTIQLALRDYFHEWQMSLCFIMALAAILAPMMVLFGLKFGVVTNMVDHLVEDPRNREIRTVGTGDYQRAWFEKMRRRSDVAFVIPRTRTIAATMDLYNRKARPSKIISVELLPTGSGDPILGRDTRKPQKLDEVILSHRAAERLQIGAGGLLDGSLSRIFNGRQERVHLPLKVLAVAKPGAFVRDGAFVGLDLLLASEDFRDGRSVPKLGWRGTLSDIERRFSGFRLYARSIYDVSTIQSDLAKQGLEVRSRQADIEVVQNLDRNLTVTFWIVASVAMIGFSLSLGSSIWANVDRKRRELSVLRLVGFYTAGIIWFPVLQALFTGLFGWMLAVLIYFGVEHGLNQLFTEGLEAGAKLCRLLPQHYGIAIGLTLGAALLASFLGGVRASRIEPAEGLREL